MYHDTLEELLNDFNSKFDTSFTTYEEVEDFVKKHNEAVYNKELAEYYISEGNMDFKYASGQTDCTSLRIGRNR